MKTRRWIILGILAAVPLANAQSSNDNDRSAECCNAQWAFNTAQKAEAFCRQQRHSPFASEGTDPCQLEKDALLQYAQEYAQASEHTRVCPAACPK